MHDNKPSRQQDARQGRGKLFIICHNETPACQPMAEKQRPVNVFHCTWTCVYAFSHYGYNYVEGEKLLKQRKQLGKKKMRVQPKKIGCRQSAQRRNCIIKNGAVAY